MSSTETVREVVREKYGQAALRVVAGQANGCCGASAALGGCDPITANLYDEGQTATLPEQAVLASLGCGNPTALAELHEGETVLDLGSGGGIDVLLSAQRVGSTGKAYGLDMTDEMLELARESSRWSRKRSATRCACASSAFCWSARTASAGADETVSPSRTRPSSNT